MTLGSSRSGWVDGGVVFVFPFSSASLLCFPSSAFRALLAYSLLLLFFRSPPLVPLLISPLPSSLPSSSAFAYTVSSHLQPSLPTLVCSLLLPTFVAPAEQVNSSYAYKGRLSCSSP